MKTPALSEADAQRAAKRTLICVGWHDGRIIEAAEKRSKSGNDMIEIAVGVFDADGNERTIRDWLTNSKLGAARLRHCCDAVGALTRYEAGEITEADFAGNACQVRIGIEKGRGRYPDQNVVLDYRAAAAQVVNLRNAG